MTNCLESILINKKREVAGLYALLEEDSENPMAKALVGEHETHSLASFKKGLNKTSIAVIAEIKRKSPSKGPIAPIVNPVQLAETYIAAGAGALSVLTDTNFFGGHINDLIEVRKQLSNQTIPILQKDFIVDKIQIAQAAVAHVSAVLCIVAVLGKKLNSYLEYASMLNIDVLVEVHNRDELNMALDCGAEIIGINNRDLKTFQVDINRASELISYIPPNIIKVAESGIIHPSQVQKYYREGFNAVLIGEALVKSHDPAKFIQGCCHA